MSSEDSLGRDPASLVGDRGDNANRYFCEVCRSIPSELPSRSVDEQQKTEEKIAQCYNSFLERFPSLCLASDVTIEFVKKGLFRSLSSGYTSLDASRPWLCYWMLHSLEILGYHCSEEEASMVVQFLNRCKDPKRGGYGGGPGQVAHAAPTYAAINALCTLGTEEAFNSIDRPALCSFFSSLHQRDGSYLMHEDGEVDIRGLYCCASVAKLVNLDTEGDLFSNSATWLSSCQTYEGGFAAVPFTEAHGGYTFCGWAALNLLEHQFLCDVDGLVKWLVCRQMAFEGGFSGRPNKLVDSCYSFWQASPLLMAQFMLASNSNHGSTKLALDHLHLPLFNAEALSEYLLLCCQHYGGGFRDKPGASKDYYHTCYALSGLSLALNFPGVYSDLRTDLRNIKLEPINPLFNVCQRRAEECQRFFSAMKTVNFP